MFDWLLGIQTALAVAGAVTPEAAAAAGEAPGTAAALIQMLLPMVLIVVVFYFMLIRPQRKKDKKVKDMLSNLKVGDRICTIGGIYGTIATIKDDTVILLVGPDKVKLVFARGAIAQVEDAGVENEMTQEVVK